jgi:hypothetical protein
MKRKVAWLLAAIAVGLVGGKVANQFTPTQDMACPIFQVPVLTGGGSGGDDECNGWPLIGGFGG